MIFVLLSYIQIMTLAASLNLSLSLLTILGQIFIVTVAAILLVGKKDYPLFSRMFSFIQKNGIGLAFIVALIATLGSLTYSDILGYEPCKLCWFQRIFMYPQVFILALAWWRKEKSIIPYGVLLACIGEIIAIYHYIIQLGWFPAPCSVSGYSVSCAKTFTLQFGYITIPLMAFTAFILIILFLMLGRDTSSK